MFKTTGDYALRSLIITTHFFYLSQLNIRFPLDKRTIGCPLFLLHLKRIFFDRISNNIIQIKEKIVLADFKINIKIIGESVFERFVRRTK